jgi:hypothetical protein
MRVVKLRNHWRQGRSGLEELLAKYQDEHLLNV